VVLEKIAKENSLTVILRQAFLFWVYLTSFEIFLITFANLEWDFQTHSLSIIYSVLPISPFNSFKITSKFKGIRYVKWRQASNYIAYKSVPCGTFFVPEVPHGTKCPAKCPLLQFDERTFCRKLRYLLNFKGSLTRSKFLWLKSLIVVNLIVKYSFVLYSFKFLTSLPKIREIKNNIIQHHSWMWFPRELW
jgi:hypothetical protein